MRRILTNFWNTNCRSVTITLTLLAMTSATFGQYSNYKVKKDSTPPDEYPYTFPILGKGAVERGFDLPLPAGIMVTYFSMDQDLAIDEISVGFNDIEPVQMDFIQFSEVKGITDVVSVRPDLWVFPFLSVYGIFAYGETETHVTLAYPVQFSTVATLKGFGYGFGATAAMGVGNFWLAVDANTSWSDLDLLDEPVRATLLSMRLGKTFELDKAKKSNFALWAGTMYQYIDQNTAGKIDLNDLFDDVDPQAIKDLIGFTEDWQDQFTPAQQVVMERISEKLQEKLEDREPQGVTVSYDLEKRPIYPWNLLLGGQYQFNKRWQLRMEAGIGYRSSFMTSLNYRFGI